MNSTHYSNYDLERQRQRLEALVQPQPSSPLMQALQQFGQGLVRFLTGGQSPCIQQRWHNGRLVWWVYDPISQRRQRFESEDELRIWLEGRYYE
ncbi:MAG: hypothetical protein RLZZ597_142 [Cyanobacteriota bacterium]|jgi:hypothetical protein